MCHVYGGINRHGLCFVYVNVWARVRVNGCRRLASPWLGLAKEKLYGGGAATIKVQTECCNSMLHKHRTILYPPHGLQAALLIMPPKNNCSVFLEVYVSDVSSNKIFFLDSRAF